MNALKGIGLAFAFFLLCFLAAFVYDHRLIARYFSVPTAHVITDVAWYQPQETVDGSFVSDLPGVAPGATIALPELNAAVDYAGAHNSVALLVYHSGKLELEKYWPPYSADTLTDSAAMSKSVLGLLTGIALKDGLINSVDDSAANYLKEWANDSRRDITIRDLLQMTSGFADTEVTENPFSAGDELLFSSDIEEVALAQKLAAPPGTVFDYNNVNSQALAAIIERQAHQRFAAYLSGKLWQKIGVGPAKMWLDRPDGTPHAFCCMQMTARDWLKVGLLVLNKGVVNNVEVVPSAWIAAMTRPSPRNPNYGMHVWLGQKYEAERIYGNIHTHASEPYEADDTLFFDGAGGQRVYVIPSADLVIVRTGDIAPDWDDAFLPNTILRGILRHSP
jgi:CubicO group peptidase (beta-lactamase class C family)